MPCAYDEVTSELVGRLQVTGDPSDVYERFASSPEARKRQEEWASQGHGSPALEDARRALLPGLLMVEQKYRELPRQWPSIFERGQSLFDVERIVELRLTGLAQLREPKGPIVRDCAPGERYVYNIESREIALSSAPFIPERTDVPVAWFASGALGFLNSCVQSEEIIHANVLNTGTVFDASIWGDGQPLFSEKHPLDNGVYSNFFGYRLDREGLEAVVVAARKFVDQAGLRIFSRPRKIVVPIELEPEAIRLMASLQKDGSAAILAPEGYCVLDYLQDPKTWFLPTNIRGLVSYERKPFKLDLKIEGDALLLEATHKYGAGFSNPRAIVANRPAI